jgi:hypothetical protein
LWIEGREDIKEANKAIQATSRRPRLMANVRHREEIAMSDSQSSKKALMTCSGRLMVCVKR